MSAHLSVQSKVIKMKCMALWIAPDSWVVGPREKNCQCSSAYWTNTNSDIDMLYFSQTFKLCQCLNRSNVLLHRAETVSRRPNRKTSFLKCCPYPASLTDVLYYNWNNTAIRSTWKDWSFLTGIAWPSEDPWLIILAMYLSPCLIWWSLCSGASALIPSQRAITFSLIDTLK